MKKAYLSGPMRGLPDNNFPLFNAAAAVLRNRGWDVHNPAEHDNPGETSRDYARRDLNIIIDWLGDDDVVIVLPYWEESLGATAEVSTAEWLGLKIMTIEEALGMTEEAYNDEWARERDLVLQTFRVLLAQVTGDGSKKRQAGMKPPWWRDGSHEAAIFSHLDKWKHGELKDKDSGAHPLVHLAWRALAIAYQETYGKRDPEGVLI